MFYFLVSLFKKFIVGVPSVEKKPEVITAPIPEVVEPSKNLSPVKKEYDLLFTTKSEPYKGPIPTDSQYMTPSVLIGSTTFLFQDKQTGELVEKKLIGLEESSLTSILEKVDEQGTVRLTRDGFTYLIGKLEENSGGLPIK